MEIVGFKLKIFQNYLFAEQPTNSLTAYSKKLMMLIRYLFLLKKISPEILSQVI